MALGRPVDEVAERVNASPEAVEAVFNRVVAEWHRDMEKGVPSDIIAGEWGIPSLSVEVAVSDYRRRMKEGGRKGKGDGDGVMGESEDEIVEVEEYVPPSAKILRRLLEKSMIPKKTIDTIMEYYVANYSDYEDRPMNLLNLLVGMDVKPNRAKLIVDKFMGILHGYGEQASKLMPEPAMDYDFNGFNPARGRRRSNNDGGETVGMNDIKRSLKEMLEVMTYSTVLKNLSMLQGGGGAGGFPYGQVNPFTATILEPVVDKDGKLVTDQFGMPVFKVIYNPVVAQQRMQQQQQQQGTGMNDTIIKAILDLQKDLWSKVVELNEKKVKELEEQLAYVSQKDPVEEIAKKVDTLKQLGLIKEGGEGSLNVDFEKWKFEKDLEIKKMMMDREDKWRERQMSFEQMKMITQNLNTALSTIGQPLATAIGEGFLKEKARQLSGPQTQGAGQGEVQGAEPDMSVMSNEELAEKLRKADEVEKMAREAKEKLRAELERRVAAQGQTGEGGEVEE